jgi:hypothetical protein
MTEKVNAEKPLESWKEIAAYVQKLGLAIRELRDLSIGPDGPRQTVQFAAGRKARWKLREGRLARHRCLIPMPVVIVAGGRPTQGMY